MEEFTNVHYVALWGFVLAAVFGFVANRANFCVMGAISDVIHMASKGRLGAWFLAIGIAILGTQALQLAGLVDVGESRYQGTSLGWLGSLAGGLLFGVGMTLGAGCGQRNLVRLGGGNLKSLVVLLVLGITAYATVRGLLGLFRVNVVEPTNIDLGAYGFTDQSFVSAIGLGAGIENLDVLRGILALLAGGGFIVYALRQRALRTSVDNLLAGVVLGAVVIVAWYVTGYLGKDDFEPVPVESMSFIASTGDTVSYVMTFTGATISFGIAVVLGMIFGSLVYAVASRSFRIETFSTRPEMVSHLVGGALMGFGGVLALGCTIGQGVSGMSTLSIGSAIAMVSIVIGSAFTMKVEYYLLDEQGWRTAVAAALSDLFVPGKRESA